MGVTTTTVLYCGTATRPRISAQLARQQALLPLLPRLVLVHSLLCPPSRRLPLLPSPLLRRLLILSITIVAGGDLQFRPPALTSAAISFGSSQPSLSPLLVFASAIQDGR
ncbi:hypothetical protein ACEPAG_732 [Sanghuangporus baumii]